MHLTGIMFHIPLSSYFSPHPSECTSSSFEKMIRVLKSNTEVISSKEAENIGHIPFFKAYDLKISRVCHISLFTKLWLTAPRTSTLPLQ